MNMNLVKKIDYGNIEIEKDTIINLFDKNINWKLDSYLKKFDKTDSDILIEMKLKRDNIWKFEWRLSLSADWNLINCNRENFNKLPDLINHLFAHIKEQIRNAK